MNPGLPSIFDKDFARTRVAYAIWAYRVEQVPSLKLGWIDSIAHFVPNLWDHLTPLQLIQMINRTTDNPNETTES